MPRKLDALENTLAVSASLIVDATNVEYPKLRIQSPDNFRIQELHNSGDNSGIPRVPMTTENKNLCVLMIFLEF